MEIGLTTIGTAGDLVPFAVLARALAARGHRVVVHTWAWYRPMFEPLADGVRFVAAAGAHTADGLTATLAATVAAPDPLTQVRTCARFFYADGAAYVAGARQALAGCDLVVANVIDHLGQAAVEAPLMILTSRPPATGDARVREDAALAAIDAEVSAMVSAAVGRRVDARVFRAERPGATLVSAWRAMIGPGDANAIVTGALLAPVGEVDVDPRLAAFARAGAPPVLVSFGSLPGHPARLAIVLDGLARAGVRAIVQTPVPLAASDRVLPVPRVVFPAVLPLVSGVICHGGAGTVAEIARGGRSMVTIPHMADQYFWGPRAASLGLGPAPIPHVALTAERVAAAVGELGPAEGRATELARRIATEDGAAHAVIAIEGAAEGRPRSREGRSVTERS